MGAQPLTGAEIGGPDLVLLVTVIMLCAVVTALVWLITDVSDRLFPRNVR